MYDPQTLYRDWEMQQWSPWEIDLSTDRQYLRNAVRRDPALGRRVRQTLRDLLPAVAESLTPPDREGTDWDALGASAEEIRAFALNGLTRRLNIVGVPLTSL